MGWISSIHYYYFGTAALVTYFIYKTFWELPEDILFVLGIACIAYGVITYFWNTYHKDIERRIKR